MLLPRSLHGSIFQRIAALAIPNIIANISTPLLGVVDTALMGQLQAPHYIGAIATAGVIFNIIFWGFGFLRMATTGLVAQSHGRADTVEVTAWFYRAVGFAACASVCLLLANSLIENFSFFLMQTSPIVEQHARQYYRIRIIAAPASLMLFAMQGWFLGIQNATYAMYITLSVNILNIVTSILLVQQFGLAANGVALGTVIAEYVGLAVGIFLLSRCHHSPFKKGAIKRETLFCRQKVIQFLTAGRDLTIRTICLTFAFAFFTAQSAKLGDTALAVNSILLQFFYIVSYGVDGVAFAGESIIGKLIGEQAPRSTLIRHMRYLFLTAAIIALLYACTFYSCGSILLRLFTNQPTLLTESMRFLPWVMLIPIISFPCFIWDGVYVAYLATSILRNTMVIATFFFYVPIHYLLTENWENHGVWFAFSLFFLVRGGLLSFCFARLRSPDSTPIQRA